MREIVGRCQGTEAERRPVGLEQQADVSEALGMEAVTPACRAWRAMYRILYLTVNWKSPDKGETGSNLL